jgi:hypothetical protein
METTLEALRKDDIGLNAASHAYPLKNIPEETLKLDKLFCCGKFGLLQKGIG